MTADVFLLADEANSSVSAVCNALGVPRSSAYERRGRKQSRRAKQTASLDVAVKAAHTESKGRYGSPRIHQELRRQGRSVSRKRVAKRMQVLNITARRPKRFRRTTEANLTHVPAENLLNRRFDGWQPDQAWVGDITFIWTLAGWAYAAFIIDLGTRAIVGWAVSNHCDTDLALRALNNAIARRRPAPGLLHHSDRGSTYTADAYRKCTSAHGMVTSMSRKGNCWDNAVAESTIGTVKTELFGDEIPEDWHHVQRMLFPYVEGFYNRRRLHSAIGYITPAEKELIASHTENVA